MISRAKSNIRRLVVSWVKMVTRMPRVVIFSGIVLSIFAAFYSARNLGVITDTSVMLSKELGYLKVYRHFKKEFPHSYNQIVILIEAVTPDLAADARDRLASELRKKSKLFPWVYLPGDDTFFKKNGLLFLSVDELEDLADSLAKAQPILARLVERTDIASLFSILADALKERKKGVEIDLSRVFSELDRTFEALSERRFYQMSWIRLMSGSSTVERNRQIIIVQPKISYEAILPGKEPIETIRSISQRLGFVPERGVRVMLTGDIPMQYDELKSVTRGAKIAGILSLVMVTVVLITGLGSFRLVLATLFPLAMGLVFTAAFATAAVGHLNMISVAFAVLFIGLGVDYAIHLSLRYRELLLCGSGSRNALLQSVQDVGPSLVLCAVTTSIGFYSFMPTDFSGVAELGLISGTGMFIALFCNVTFLPAMISIFPLKSTAKQPYYITSDRHPIFLRITAWPYKHASSLRWLAIILTFLSLWFVPRVRFDSNPINLRDPNAESIRAFKKLLEDPNGSPWSLESLAGNEKEAQRRKESFERLDLVRHALSLSSFVPSDQDDKLDIISDMDLILGPIVEGHVHVESSPLKRQILALKGFRLVLEGTMTSLKEDAAMARNLDVRIGQFVSHLDLLDTYGKQKEIERLTNYLLASFPKRIEELSLALSAAPVSMNTLPKDLVHEWIGLDGSWRIEVVPAKNPRNDEEIRAFIKEARKVDKNVTGYPVLIMEGGKAVVRAFEQAFGYSILSILLLLLVLMPKRKDALLVVYSLFLAGLLSGAIMVFLGLSLNFANIIALPLILGIGVDNGIHIVHRHRQAMERPTCLLQTSTARAIFFSTLTTICSFGNLAVSPHLGMASMGKLLTIGIVMALVTSTIFIPAFLSSGQALGQREDEKI